MTENRSEARAHNDEADDHEVKAALRRLGATEDIRAYVYRTLIDIMPDRIYAKDRQSRFILANRSVARLMGKRGPEELIGKTDFDFYPPEMANEFLSVEREIFQTGEPQIAVEQFVPNLPNGEPEWLQTTKVPLRDFEGEVIGLVGIARDVTQRKLREDECRRQREELEESNAKLSFAYEQLLRFEQLAGVGHLAAGVANEISEPLGKALAAFSAIEARLDEVGAILGTFAAASAQECKTPEVPDALRNLCAKADLGDLLSETRSGLARVSKIVQDLREFSDTDTAADLGEMDLNHAIDSALNILGNEIRHKADVVTEFGDVPVVVCVVSQIHQVIVNLLINAAQAIGDARGTITVRTCADGDNVWFEVCDTGSGIESEALKRLFEPFFTTRPAGQGAGLGLPLCYGIVQRHQGRIEVESEVGHGSTFRVFLPAENASD